MDRLEERLCLATLFTLAPGSPISVGYIPNLAAVGDFDGGSNPDLAVTHFDGGLSVLLGNGEGGLTASAQTIAGLFGSIATGDFTANGRLDLAVVTAGAREEPDTVSVFVGNGDGTFASAPGPPITVGDSAVDVAVGDLAGNAQADMVVANSMSDSLSVLLGNGNGTFTAAPTLPLGFSPDALTLGDFNGDGKLDIAVAGVNGLQGEVLVLLGDGTGDLSAAGPGTVFPGGSGFDIVAGDFTGNGRLDLAVDNEGDNDVTVLLNNGDGQFVRGPGRPINVGLNPSGLEVGDFTGNGTEDIAVDNSGASTTSVLLGNGNGTFKNAPGSPFKGDLLGVGDFDGNSEPDLVVGTPYLDTVSVLLNTTPVGQFSGSLGATVSARLPTTVVGGARIKGTASVTVTAPAASAVNGPVSIALYASETQSLSGATQLMPAATPRLAVKAGGSRTVRLPISSLPSTLAGTYYLLAQVTAPGGPTTVAVGPTVTIAKPVVSIIASNLGVSPASLPPGGKLSVRVALQNAGNVPVSGSAGLTISLSSSASGAGAIPAATVPLRVKLRTGQSSRSRLRIILPRGTAAGSYYIVVSLDVGALGDVNAADGMAVSAIRITVK